MRRAKVYMYDDHVGNLIEDESGYTFQYLEEYVNAPDSEPISLTLPLQSESYSNNVLFPFFDGLIPEGWLLDIAEKNWKLDARDRMGLLLQTCRDCIGAVSILPYEA
ncbi:HipA N-terminal domain-containing protein [Roseivirga sp. BDSF3-8]|uniref:HipA N-terminal domain-containing protein n=1 Tax=Roseivirga sp. BDSF3-8 TaxID=3241598 RepID=UPI0035318D0B